jgi:hypothetical protein
MSAAVAAGFSGILRLSQPDAEESNTIVGPRKGYTPEIGTLTSMMGFMRWQVFASAKGLTQNDLDFLLDDKTNTIGAMFNTACRIYYQRTLQKARGWAPGQAIKPKWDVAMGLKRACAQGD